MTEKEGSSSDKNEAAVSFSFSYSGRLLLCGAVIQPCYPSVRWSC